MKKSVGLLMCLSIFTFYACKKSNPAPTVNTTRVGNIYDDSSHVTTIYNYSPTYLINASFDDSGRYNYAYHYLDGQSVTEIAANYIPQYSVYYIWGSQSLVDSSDVINANGTLGMRKKYSYNGSNYLTGVNWYSDANVLMLTESYTIANGNITQHTYNVIDTTSTSSLPVGSYSYQYYSGQTNTLSNLYLGQAYLGTSSTNPVKSCTYTNGSVTTITDYTYHYSGGLVTSQLVFADSSGVPGARVDSIHYNYYIQ